MTLSLNQTEPRPRILQDLDLPCETFRLDNGLTVIVHEDRKAPVVAVSVTYLVGSKDEPPGKTGFAHLFEHLMFCGSQNLPGSYVVNLLNAGASDVNATTSRDRTNYVETVPTSALDYALFAESDRMGHFLEGLTLDGFDQQRGVVSNEKYQNEGEPYGRVHGRMLAAMFAPHHPYAHEVIGSMDDLARATLDDVKAWFTTFYGPANCVLALAGDIDAATAREKATRFFGHIAPGGTPVRRTTHIAPPRLAEPLRETVHDQVPYPELTFAWHLPCLTDPQTTALQAAAALLAGSPSARLQRALVDCSEPLALAVTCLVEPGELCSLLRLQVTARDTEFDAVRLEARITHELTELARKGPDEEELRILKCGVEADFIRGLAQANAVAGLLGDSYREYGRADGYRVWIEQFVALTPQTMADAVSCWVIGAHPLRLEVKPVPSYQAGPVEYDRSAPPPLGVPPAPRMPPLQRGTLSNGLKLVFAERRERPVLDMNLIFNGGHANDPQGLQGVASLTATLMNGAVGERDQSAFSQHLRSIGTELVVGAGTDDSSIHLSCLRGSLDASLVALNDVLRRPRFEDAAFTRELDQQRQSILMQMASPSSAAHYVLPGLLYPPAHPYASPWTGTGTAESLAGMTREDVLRCHARTYRPSGATLVVAGDASFEDLMRRLEAGLVPGWTGDMPPARVEEALPPAWQPGVNLMPRADSSQSWIIAGQFMPAADAQADVALDVIDQVLGRNFSSRINMNLREDKHWTYGTHSSLLDVRGPRPYLIQAAVQADKTVAAMQEIAAELKGVAGLRPITEQELASIKQSEASRLAALTETSSGLCHAIALLVRMRLPDDHWQTRAEKLQALQVEGLNATARRLFDGPGLLWLVIGEGAEIELQMRTANMGAWRTV